VAVLGMVEGGGRREEESHQRVTRTRWWSFWAGSRAEGKGKPPTSLKDSLVAGSRAEDGGKPPTSHKDSLVVIRAGKGGWRGVVNGAENLWPKRRSSRLLGLFSVPRRPW
jgi:hypothetical protein